MMTNQRLVNLAGLEKRRIIHLNKMKALTRTTQPANWTLVLHVEDEYDYQIWTERREDFIRKLKAQCQELTATDLPVNDVYRDVAQYQTTWDDRERGTEKELPRQIFSSAGDNYVGFEDFEQVKIIGAGTFGKVHLVRKKDT